MTSAVLLVEDDPTIGRSLEQALTAEGYRVTLAVDGATARAAFTAESPDLVLLDLGLPDLDGVELCREMRLAGPRSSIIVLTARREEADIVVGLDAGADDYVTKPFRLAELLARVRAHLRGPMVEQRVERIDAADLHIDVAGRRSWIGPHELALRPREHDLLVLLASEPGRVINARADHGGGLGRALVRLHQDTRRARLVVAPQARRVSRSHGSQDRCLAARRIPARYLVNRHP